MRIRLLIMAMLFACRLMAQDAFVIVKQDGSKVACKDRAAVTQNGTEWTLDGKPLSINDKIERFVAEAEYQQISFEDCIFPEGKRNNLVKNKDTIYVEAGITFRNQEKYSMFAGVLVSEESEVSKWQDEYPGVGSKTKVVTTDTSKPAGANGSSKYAILRYDKYISGTLQGLTPEFAFDNEEERGIVSLMVNNTTETWQNCKIGYYSKPGFADGDYFEVILTGFNANGEETGTVVIPMADYRDGKTYICGEWTQIDVSSLGKVNKVVATYRASEAYENISSASFGVCIDNITFEK